MLRDLEEIDDSDTPGLLGNFGGDVGEGYLEDLRHDNLAWRKRVPTADLHVRSLPQANGGRDLTATNAVAQGSDELHRLRSQKGLGRRRVDTVLNFTITGNQLCERRPVTRLAAAGRAALILPRVSELMRGAAAHES